MECSTCIKQCIEAEFTVLGVLNVVVKVKITGNLSFSKIKIWTLGWSQKCCCMTTTWKQCSREKPIDKGTAFARSAAVPGSWSDSRRDRLLAQAGLRTVALLFGPQHEISLLY